MTNAFFFIGSDGSRVRSLSRSIDRSDLLILNITNYIIAPWLRSYETDVGMNTCWAYVMSQLISWKQN